MRGLPVRFAVGPCRKGPRFPGLRRRQVIAAQRTEKTPDSLAVQGVFPPGRDHENLAFLRVPARQGPPKCST